MTYEVSCSRCGLEQKMNGLDAVLDFEDDHKERFGESHIFDFTLVQ